MSTALTEVSHRILLVEDDVDGRDATVCGFELEGAEVTPAADGYEALYALRNGPRPCLILLDLDMAGMDGHEFRRRQLLWPQMARIPVIVVSAHADLKVATRAISARAVLAKPVQFDLLRRAVDEHCADADPEAGALRLRRSRMRTLAASARRC
jgi:CheY-like chemotaxis protein